MFAHVACTGGGVECSEDGFAEAGRDDDEEKISVMSGDWRDVEKTLVVDEEAVVA